MSWNLEAKRHPVGDGFHRSGWPWVYDGLKGRSRAGEILLCDFVEERFCYWPLTFRKPPAIAPAGCYNAILEPWVGIFHHPPNPPPFSNQRENIRNIVAGEDFQNSLPSLRLAVTLTDYLAAWLRTVVPCPVVTLRYPTEVPERCWTQERFRGNPWPQMVSLGHWCRNTRLLYQIPPVAGWGKVRLLPSFTHVLQWDALLGECYADGRLPDRPNYEVLVETVGYQPNEVLDALLSANVVAMEVYDASASTVLVECIARGTPILCNRHPALVEYLGTGYPLYFDEPEEIPGLLPRVPDGAEYLQAMDRSWLSRERFCGDLERAIGSVGLLGGGSVVGRA